ncbi:hypothetical protein D6D23_07780 [Aureobasidium pullulans]|uniref:Polyketide cyclase/dehydrase n=1 Tax=Aureobasidium pullulans TaxID=5580 RepID=A0A4S9AR51_AURPU|nr:hypothetical protein D6D23_07780 [Aureobasidium pullulans]THW65136.1 hypothetical protein D6D20_02341 [Aureobasidium pullulans]THW82420.1 hypothetical protein D6D18_08418 [Aureobasidium pullulans]TIA13348.1 hypothetical protein D6C81_07216 [Aureobasidium pullulans]
MADTSTPRPTPTIPSGGFFSAYAEATVTAPPSTVYNALIDTSIWGDWNSFVPSVTIVKRSDDEADSIDPGIKKDMVLSFEVNMTPSMTTNSKEIVTHVDECPSGLQPGRITRINWIMDNKGSFTPKFILVAERVNEIEDLGDGTCIYRSWETFSGLAARIVKWKFGQALQKNFENWVTGIKQYVQEQEQRAKDRDAAVELPA